MSKLKLPYNTIIEALLDKEECTEFGARFIPKSGDPVFYTYNEILSRARAVAGALQAWGLVPGDCVALILPTSIDFLDAFLGSLLAGGIPAALYPPFRLGRLDEYYQRTQGMLNKIGAQYLITDRRIGKLLGPVINGVKCLERVLNPGELQGSFRWDPVSVDPESPAFLQFTSGATREPKAVIVTHTNLLCNLEMMDSIFRTFPLEVLLREAVCWLPLYHDMGLVGCLFNGLYHPATMNYINPDHFISRPAIWLQTISRYNAGISPAPQFAYNLCAEKIKDEEMAGVDLSDWVVALNGAEPIDIQGMRKFMERFNKWGFRESAMTPVYGLAEAGLAVTFSDFGKAPIVTEFDQTKLGEEGRAVVGSGHELASVGRPMKGLEVIIRSEQDYSLEDGLEGKIMARGPSITPGYYHEPDLTDRIIRNNWLDTGDLGFINNGYLYITGRSKDLIIIRGRNIAPQEIESFLYDIGGIRSGCAVAFGTLIEGRGEQLVILAEKDIRKPRTDEELVMAVKKQVVAAISITPYHVQILEPGTLPRTSSGKMRRSDAMRMYLSGDLVPPDKMGLLKLLHRMGKSQVEWGRYFLKRRGGKQP